MYVFFLSVYLLSFYLGAAENVEDDNAIAGGKPRSLDFEDGQTVDAVVRKTNPSAVKVNEYST